jgi:hypothetical protein
MLPKPDVESHMGQSIPRYITVYLGLLTCLVAKEKECVASEIERGSRNCHYHCAFTDSAGSLGLISWTEYSRTRVLKMDLRIIKHILLSSETAIFRIE